MCRRELAGAIVGGLVAAFATYGFLVLFLGGAS
jgi:hypothetical protein